jgi:hypothetical protein
MRAHSRGIDEAQKEGGQPEGQVQHRRPLSCVKSNYEEPVFLFWLCTNASAHGAARHALRGCERKTFNIKHQTAKREKEIAFLVFTLFAVSF